MRKYLFLPLIVLLSFQCKNASKEGETVEAETSDVSNMMDENGNYAMAEFTIEGMTSAMGCAKTIETNLLKTKGIAFASVNFDNRTAQVKFEGKLLKLTDLEAVVTASGDMYKVVDLKEVTAFSSDNSKKTPCTMACCKDKSEAEKMACEMACCKTKSDSMACKADCTKPCCKDNAKSDAKACKADCTKPCYKDKVKSDAKACEVDCKKECCKDKKA